MQQRFPDKQVTLLEKVEHLAVHQTGHNSGLIYSGIYYKPGSDKAQLYKAGNATLHEFCREHGIPFAMCGKVIVATEKDELPQLVKLHQRGIENGLETRKLNVELMSEIEPHSRGVGLPSSLLKTGVTRASNLCVFQASCLKRSTTTGWKPVAHSAKMAALLISTGR